MSSSVPRCSRSSPGRALISSLKQDRDALIRSLTEIGPYSDISSDESSRTENRKKASLRQLKKPQTSGKKVREVLGGLLLKKSSEATLEDEKRKLKKLLDMQDYCENQITFIRRAVKNDRFDDVQRTHKNLLNYMNNKEVPFKLFYMTMVNIYMARAFLTQSLVYKARVCFQKAAGACEGTSRSDLYAERDLLEGEILVAEKKFKEAAKAWEQALVNVDDPERVSWLHHELGRCYLEAEDLENSARHAEVSANLKVAPWKCYSLMLLGQIAAQKGELEKAVEYFTTAEETSKTTPDSAAVVEYTASSLTSLKKTLKIKKYTEKSN